MPLDQIKYQQEIEQSALGEALVIGGGSDKWIIQTETGTLRASKAFSCLVCPEIGDKVLTVSLASGCTSILAILERQQSQPTRLKFEDNMEISSTRSIRIMAADRLDAFAGEKMTVDAKKLDVRSQVSSVLFDKLRVTGAEAVQSVGKIQVLAKYIETVSETSKQVMNNSFRLVSGLESVIAGEILQNVKKRFTLQSRQVSMLAEDDAKLNGKRVHLG